MEETNPLQKYPNIEISYQQVSTVLSEQKQIASALDSKAAVIFATATAIVGLGIPLGFSMLLSMTQRQAIILCSLAIIPLGAYARCLIEFWNEYRLREFRTLNDPTEIRGKFAVLHSREMFYYNALLNTELFFRDNKVKIQKKARSVDRLGQILILELAAILSWSCAAALLAILAMPRVPL